MIASERNRHSDHAPALPRERNTGKCNGYANVCPKVPNVLIARFNLFICLLWRRPRLHNRAPSPLLSVSVKRVQL